MKKQFGIVQKGGSEHIHGGGGVGVALGKHNGGNNGTPAVIIQG